MPRSAGRDPSTNTKSAARTLDIFERFALTCRPMTLTELAKALEIPVSSLFHLMGTLERRGFAYTLGPRRGFYPTRRMLSFMEMVAANDPLHRLVAPELEALRDETGETVVLAQRLEAKAMVLDVFESRHSIRYSAEIGTDRPLHSTAVGKALLGAAPREEWDALLGPGPLPKVTETTFTDRAELARELDESNRRGWFMTRGENIADVHAISAVVSLYGQSFAICVAGPHHRFGQQIDSHVAALLARCDRIRGIPTR